MQITERERQEAISIELADLYQRQMTIILCNRLFHFDEPEAAAEIFYDIATEDIWIFERIAASAHDSPVKSEPKKSTLFLAETVMDIVADASILQQERLSAYVLLKQSQLSSCRILERSLRVIDKSYSDVLLSVAILSNTLEAQLKQLNAQVEDRSFAWITGEPELILARDRFAAHARLKPAPMDAKSKMKMGKVLDFFDSHHKRRISKHR